MTNFKSMKLALDGGPGSGPHEGRFHKMKANNIQIKEPLGFSKDPDFGHYAVEHPNFPKGQAIEGKHLTIKNGKVVGMHPSLAKQLGIETVGNQASPTNAQATKIKTENEAKAKAKHDANVTVAAMHLQSTVNKKQISPEEATRQFHAALQRNTKSGFQK